MYNWDRESCPLYRVAGCPLFRGCLSIEVNGRTVGTFRIVCYIMGVHFSGVSVNQGSTVVLLVVLPVGKADLSPLWSCVVRLLMDHNILAI